MKRLATAAVIAIVTIGAGLYWLLESRWFDAEVERRVVQELAAATGARVETDGLEFDWKSLRIHAGPVILRGTEEPGRDPLLRMEALEVGLALDFSSRAGVRVTSIAMYRPVATVSVAADGTTNLPESRDGRPLPEALAEFALHRLEIRNGELRWNDRRIPIDVRANDIAAKVAFLDSAREYRGHVSAERIEGAWLPLNASGDFALSASRLQIESAEIRTPRSSATVSGEVTNWRNPEAAFQASVRADLAEIAGTAGRKEIEGGEAEASLAVRFDANSGWRVAGPVRGSGIGARWSGERVRDVSFRADLDADAQGARLTDFSMRALSGEFRGGVEIESSRRFRVQGTLAGVEIPGSLAARVSGRLNASGSFERLDLATASLQLAPTQGRVPVAGTVDAEYRQGDIAVRRSELMFGGSHVNFSGSLGQGLTLRVRTSDAADLLPALQLLSDEVPGELPFTLENQPAEFQGTISGPVEAIHISGRLTARTLAASGQRIEFLSADGEANENLLTVRRASFERDGAKAQASGKIAMRGWRVGDESALEMDVEANQVNLSAFNLPISGTARAKAAIGGSPKSPRASGSVQVNRGTALGEAFDAASANFEGSKDRVTLSNVEIARGAGRIRGSGEWSPSRVMGSATVDRWEVGDRLAIGKSVTASGRLQGEFQVANGEWRPKAIDGRAEIRAQKSGSAVVNAVTAGDALKLAGTADIFGAKFAIDSKWRLEPGLPGGGSIRIDSLTQTAIERAAELSGDSPLPFEATVEGTGEFTGKLLEPDRLGARFRLPVLQIKPRQAGLATAAIADLTLRNQGPVLLAAASTGIVIEQAKFTAKETELAATGNIAFRRADQMNFLLRGQVNLAVLDAFNPDIAAAGQSTLNLRLRGPAKAPRVEGRLAFEGASFNLRGFPNGLDDVTGAVIFDRNRASVDGLRGQSGGGEVVLNGYVGFGSELSYQLQMALNRVRVRYPEGLSTQASAALVLSGTSKRSLLSGSVTVLRTGLTPTTDVGGLLSAQPPGAPTPDDAPDFRRGLQLDLRVETAQSAQFSTELTKNVEADIDVRIRGTALRPVVLGRVSITRGSVQFFGTDYTINRGEVSFINPVTVEPQVDLDLETRVRGILVSVSFTGPLNRMSMSYRSDPPLQSAEILALLAVGRAPTSASTLGFSSVRGNDLLNAGGTAVLSSALNQGSAGSNNLQRFFGVTRLKIDPQLIGLDNTPQSRLSFEQPISRDVTVTYSQTLARAQGQLVRVQWDLNRQWSALLTRDENGIVSVDFVFRKSFR